MEPGNNVKNTLLERDRDYIWQETMDQGQNEEESFSLDEGSRERFMWALRA